MCIRDSYNPIQIVGEEINARYFFFYFFHSSYSELDDETEKGEQEVFNEMIQYGKKNHFNSLTIDKFRMENWLRIANVRISQKNLIEFDSKIKTKYLTSDGFENLKDVVTTVDPTSQILQRNENELLYIYLSAINSIVYNKQSNYFYNESFFDFTNYECVVTDFFKEMNFNYRDNLNLYTMLKSYLYNIEHLSCLLYTSRCV
nr:hypothetical protein A5881_004005 [Enterococcus termitis]